MARIQIVTAGPLCRNPRVLKEATTLGLAGFDVAVLTVANIGRFEAFDRELMRGAPFRKMALDRVSQGPVTRFIDLTERALGRLARIGIGYGIESPASLGPFHALRRLVLNTPADLTILHTEVPFAIGPSLVARGRRIAADFEDWHSRDLLPSSRATRPLRMLDRDERFLMRNCAYTSAPSMAMAAALKAAYGGDMPTVIPNTFPLQPQPAPLPRQTPPAFLWFSQTIGEGRGLEAFISAWARCRAASSVCLLGDVSLAYKEKLIGLVPPSRSDSLRFLPITSPENLPNVIAQHDIGLALEPTTPESRFLTTTNKIFQYLNAGLAVLATRTEGQREILSVIPDAGMLVDIDDPQLLTSSLDTLLDDRERLAAMGRAARRGAVVHFSWELAAPRLVEAVKRALQP